MREQQRNPAAFRQLAGDAAEEVFAESRVTVGAHHDEAGVELQRGLLDGRADAAVDPGCLTPWQEDPADYGRAIAKARDGLFSRSTRDNALDRTMAGVLIATGINVAPTRSFAALIDLDPW
jgi:hypothetical protein